MGLHWRLGEEYNSKWNSQPALAATTEFCSLDRNSIFHCSRGREDKDQAFWALTRHLSSPISYVAEEYKLSVPIHKPFLRVCILQTPNGSLWFLLGVMLSLAPHTGNEHLLEKYLSCRGPSCQYEENDQTFLVDVRLEYINGEICLFSGGNSEVLKR